MPAGLRSEWWRGPGGVYLVVQGAGVVVYWLWLVTRPREMALFVPEGSPGRVFLVFLGADVLVLASSSVAAGVGMWLGARWGRAVLAVHVGAAVYAGLCAAGLWALDASRWLGVGMMAPVMVVPPWLLWVGRELGRGSDD